jgi:multiple sugar transport system ATP-binding protein
MRTEIARLHRALKTTMIYVTHDQVEAMTLGQRIVVLDRGIVQQIDTPMAIYERPVNLFVAGFLGNPAMNFFRGTLSDAPGGQGVLEGEGAELLIPAIGLPRGRPIVVGIRPEDLQRVDVATAPGNIRIGVQIELIETIGNEAFIHASVGAWRVIMRSSPYHLPPLGSNITLQVAPERLHFFAGDSGARIEG